MTKDKLQLLDLFAGIGGFSLGLERAGMETAAFCEILPECQVVLRKHWPEVPIYADVTQLKGADLGQIDIISGGFPCQDISNAGRQKGLTEGSRSGTLWEEYRRLIGEIRPRWVLIENVKALISGGGGEWFARLLGDLAALRYDAEWHCIPAAYAGAPHIRDRVWILAYPQATGRHLAGSNILNSSLCIQGGNCWPLDTPRVLAARRRILSAGNGTLHRTDDGFTNILDRIRILGGTVVVPIVEGIGRAIVEAEAKLASTST